MGKTPHPTPQPPTPNPQPPTPTEKLFQQTLSSLSGKLAIELTINKITVSRRRDETLPKNSYS
ncbi:MAG: hypothetical protein IM319_07535 [Microcystis sp. M113S1]|uniref:hypothetical protein n=1 Tax=Microcystis sp. M113S1 TaxID=2771104 RepID=UPI0025875E89|nr:hypothetical protein [Microcystis sp. M113S1]MCA2939021.1 hypothetical protein [Microcystis sp. M113S1]